MLVLTRAIGESFRIGDDVEILVADTNGAAVKLPSIVARKSSVHPIKEPLIKRRFFEKALTSDSV